MPEALFNDVLLEFSRTAVTVAEVGQRLHSLMNYNIGPQWLVFNLAALYWRGIGVVQEAVNCLRLALHNKSAKTMADVSLVQLSYLVYAAGNRLDDAVVLARQAVEMDETEPMAQYLLGFYLAVKENFTGAELHLKKAAAVQPNINPIEKLLKSVRCKLKVSQQREIKAMGVDSDSISDGKRTTLTGRCRSPPTSESENDMPTFFCIKEDGEERCYLEERNSPGGSLDKTEEEGIPTCVSPPPSAVPTKTPIKEMVNSKEHQMPAGKKWKLSSADLKLPSLVDANEDQLDQSELSLLDDTLLRPSEEKLSEEQEKAPKVVKLFHHSPEIKDGEGVPLPNNVKFRVKQKTGERPILEIFAESSGEQTEETESLTNPLVTGPEPPVKPFSPGGDTGVPPDVPLPEVLPEPSASMVKTGSDLFKVPTSTAECSFWKNKVKLDMGTSTWLSISAKKLRSVSA